MSIQKSRYWMVAFTFLLALLRSGLMFSSVTTTDTGTGISPQMGDVIEEKEMTAVPLVTRSYTDLLALQPGVVSPSSMQQLFSSQGMWLAKGWVDE
jgi:hypothetical protein